MTQFEFFMGFYALLLGLGVAQLLGGLANLVREKSPPKLGVLIPLVAVMVLIEIVAGFIDAWEKFRDIGITLAQLTIPTLIGVLYFFIASIVVPRDLSEWANLDDYYVARRKWLMGLVIVVNLLIISLEVPRLERTIASGNGSLVSYVFENIAFMGSYTLALLASRRWLQIAALVSVLALFAYFYGYSPLVVYWNDRQ
jgi:fucose 4-O-acetylase-like acetyltransferase